MLCTQPDTPTVYTAHCPRPAAHCLLPAAGCATGRLRTLTNNSGGIQGGITNGEAITFRIAFKPPATIGKEQATATCVSATRQRTSASHHFVHWIQGVAGLLPPRPEHTDRERERTRKCDFPPSPISPTVVRRGHGHVWTACVLTQSRTHHGARGHHVSCFVFRPSCLCRYTGEEGTLASKGYAKEHKKRTKAERRTKALALRPHKTTRAQTHADIRAHAYQDSCLG